MTTTDTETFGKEIARHASEFAPRRRRPPQQEAAQETQENGNGETQKESHAIVQQVLTPNALRIATQLDIMERERLTAIQERDAALARIEQFERRQTELLREKQALETKVEDAARSTELERNERIRLSNVIESAIQLFQQKLPMPEPQ